jgi:4-amino-4-deoxy-L-arabinose transferase-like glycosyltransferase/putative flippase GtrA
VIINDTEPPTTSASPARQHAGMALLLHMAKGVATGPLPFVPAVRRPDAIDTSANGTRRMGRHKRSERHAARLGLFGVIGACMFLGGLAMQIALVRGLRMDATAAYLISGIASIQASYLLNRYVTWRDKPVGFWAALWRFNIQKAGITVVNVAAYAILVRLGVQYVVANVALTAVLTPLNYVAGHYWSFAASRAATPSSTVQLGPPDRRRRVRALSACPTVSAVIPCKNNPGTIRATVDALLRQNYPNLVEVICVGDIEDTTWDALAHIRDPRLIVLEQEPTSGRRDPNVKRDKGIRFAIGEVIALVDSDIVMDPNWLPSAVIRLQEQNGGLVAGGMRSIRDTFLGRFVDRNALAAKTPRLGQPYWVTAETFGRRGFKPPITANAVLTRELYELCPLDTAWSYGYEDYEWFWRLAREQHKILFTGEMTAAHHHRSSFRALVREYRRSAEGCTQFVLAHPDSPLARKRLRQALLLPVAGLAAVAAVALALASGLAVEAAGALAAVTLTLMIREGVRARSLEGTTYLFLGLPLAVLFTVTLSWSLFVVATPSFLRRHRHAILLGTAICGGVALRLWHLGTAPDWQVDEVTYTAIARNIQEHGTLNLPIAYGAPWQPFLFHPPFYFLLLARWFAVVGAGIYQARLLGVIGATVAMCLLARLVWKSYGSLTAAITVVFLATDGWLLYVQRVSYMENILLVLVVATVLAYQKALESHSIPWYLLAGALGGAAVIFKHTGAYVLAAMTLGWLLTRRDHRGHVVALATTAAIAAAYVFTMIRLFDIGRHKWYIAQTLVQVRRALGKQVTGGTLTSPSQLFHLVSHQYAVFVPSLLIGVAGIALLAADCIRCLRARNLAVFKGQEAIAAWALAGIICFGAISLKYTQYFAMVLVPVYCYLWGRIVRALHGRIRPWLAVAGLCVVAIVGVASFGARAAESPGNVFQAATRYVNAKVPASAVVVAETPIDYEIRQRWCSPTGGPMNPICVDSASYLVTWQTYLQPINPYHYASITALLARAVPVKTFRGFSGTATIWRLR